MNLLALLLGLLEPCSAPMASMKAERSPITQEVVLACAEVALRAPLHGVPPALATRWTFWESRFRRYPARGNKTPFDLLQAKPIFWCRGGIVAGCDGVEAGLKAARHALVKARGNHKIARCIYAGRKRCWR